MDQEILKKIQDIDYDALIAFKQFCDEHNISFFLRGGSVMGAVKYSNFIPWDDDIDVAVPREDYKRLLRYIKDKKLDDRFIINSYLYNENLHCYFPRMVLSEDERIKQGLPKNTNLGLHIIDIFPLDGAPNNSIHRKLYIIHVYILRALASLGTHYSGEWKNMHSKKQELLIKVLRKIGFERIFPQRRVYKSLDRLYTKDDWRKQKYAGTITASQFAKEIFPKDVWGKGCLFPIRDEMFMVPEKYDEYLKKLYGNNYLNEEPEHKKSHL